MKRSSKLWSVIRHEYLTIVKQPAFLLTLLSLPVLMAGVMGLSYFAERTAETSLEQAMEQVSDIVVVDESGLIREDVARSFGIELGSERAQHVIDEVQSGAITGAIVYPADLADTREFDVYMSEGDYFTVSSALTDIGEQLLTASLLAPLGDEQLASLVTEGTSSNITAFRDGRATGGVAEFIVPAAFLVVFFIILFFSMGYMLLGVAEEKENRSMEMVLSYLRPRTLITGKLLGVSLVALTQLAFFVVLGGALLLVGRQFGDQLGLPLDIDLAGLTFDPATIAIGLSVLVLGFLLFAALMSGAASMAPGVKEANSLSSVFFMVPFAPFILFGAIATAPGSAFVQFLSFFPITSPTTLLLRNTLGNISLAEAAAAIAVLALFVVLAFALAAKLFRLGALEYADRLKLTAIFKK